MPSMQPTLPNLAALRRTAAPARPKPIATAPLLLGALLLAAVLLAAPPARAAEQFQSGPNYRGIINFDPYAVFPENRVGNAVYLNNVLLLTLDKETITDVLPLTGDGRFVYLAKDAEGKSHLGVHVLPTDGDPRITPVAEDFYHVVLFLGGVVYKKMYRVIDGNLLDLLPSSKTADGAVAGPGGVLFYHVATADKEQVDGQEKNVFGLALHLALFNDERLRNLNYLIKNSLPRLELKWEDDSRISYRLADGRTEVLSVSQFQ